MKRRSVAVLDVRSAEVTVLLGERGVNHTFVFKASKTEPYDGYEDGAFYDTSNLKEAVSRALASVEQTCGERVSRIFVGVPGEFTEVVPKERDIGFPSARRIGQRELNMLFESGREELEGATFMRAASMIYVTADNRRVVNPVGLVTSGLSAALTYFYCKDYFRETVGGILTDCGVAEVHYIPAEYSQAMYLISSETRDEYALFLDVGSLSSTVCVVLGNGILAQQTFWAGKGQIAVRLMERFSLPYDAAVALLAKANLFRRSETPDTEFNFRNHSYEVDSDALIDEIKCGLDEICEGVSAFLEECRGKELDYKPLYVTGEGLCEIRGALEHVSKRLNRVSEQVAPNLPYYNKPSVSSRIALADMAYEDNRKSGFLYRLLNGFGG